MSGICGYVNFDQRPINTKHLKIMATAAVYRGRDGIHYWQHDNAGLVHLNLHTTTESMLEDQPIVSSDGRFVLVADARIDDRRTLAKKLELTMQSQSIGLSDAKLILLSWMKWRESCTEHLVGDFAFVIWDQQRNRVFAARDRLGNKPFYFSQTANSFFWASEACQLLQTDEIDRQLDEIMIVRDLASPGLGGRHRSFFKSIKKLGPAEFICIDKDNFQRRIYWNLEPADVSNYKMDEDYVEEFFQLWSQVVYDRLRSTHTTGLFLSGGLDSSAIAAIAANQRHQDHEFTTELHTVNFINSRTETANEHDQSRAVAEYLALDYREIDVAPYPFLAEFPGYSPHPDEPYSSHLESYFLAALLTQESAPNVWMTGHPGDMISGGINAYHFIELFKQKGVGAMISRLREQSRIYSIPLLQLFNEYCLKPVYIEPLKQRIKKLIHYKRTRYPPWIDAGFAQQTHLLEWLNHLSASAEFSYKGPANALHPLKQIRIDAIMSHQEARTEVWFDRLAARFNAEMWNPWNDYRLGEFILTVPEDKINLGLENKLLLRKALEGLLPSSIINIRKPRTGPGLGILNDIRTNELTRAKIDGLLIQTNSSRIEPLNKSVLRRILEDVRCGRKEMTIPMCHALSLERWLQHYFDGI